jgi:hypothetical protein
VRENDPITCHTSLFCRSYGRRGRGSYTSLEQNNEANLYDKLPNADDDAVGRPGQWWCVYWVTVAWPHRAPADAAVDLTRIFCCPCRAVAGLGPTAL